jgi:hypothetical protein
MPADWQQTLKSDNQIVGDAYWDPVAKRAKADRVRPRSADGRLLGAFAAEAQSRSRAAAAALLAPDSTGAIHLVNTKGAPIASSDGCRSS